jgi:hypothetical protein
LEPEIVPPLIGLLILIALVGYFVYWPNSADEKPKSTLLFLLRILVWGGYALVVLLLVTDVAWPEWLTGASSASEGPDCPPVVGREAWTVSPRGISEATCTTLANARIGWALLVAIASTIFLAALTRVSIRNDIADAKDPQA